MTQSTRERALSDALYAIVQRCSATLPDDCDYARWRRQSASSIGELLNDARAALALPPDAPPAAPVATGEHTPGKWTARPKYEERGKFAGHRMIYAVNGGMICAIGKGPHEDRNEANARLIAAAPDMLAALQRVESLIGDVSNRALWPTLGPVADSIRAAIARATGREG